MTNPNRCYSELEAKGRICLLFDRLCNVDRKTLGHAKVFDNANQFESLLTVFDDILLGRYQGAYRLLLGFCSCDKDCSLDVVDLLLSAVYLATRDSIMCNKLKEILQSERESKEHSRKVYDNSDSHWSFDVIHRFKAFISENESNIETVQDYDYAMFVVRSELAACMRSRIFCSDSDDRLKEVVPQTYLLKDGSSQSISTGTFVDVELTDSVLSAAVYPKRLKQALHCVWKDGFHTNIDCQGYYIKGMDLALVDERVHAANAGIFFGEGSVHLAVLDATKLFDHIDTDGKQWINMHTKESVGKVADIRVAILYKLAQMRDSFMKSIRPEVREYCEMHARMPKGGIEHITFILNQSEKDISSFLRTLNVEELPASELLTTEDKNIDKFKILLDQSCDTAIVVDDFGSLYNYLWQCVKLSGNAIVKLYYIGSDNAARVVDSRYLNSMYKWLNIDQTKDVWSMPNLVEFIDYSDGFMKVAEMRNRQIMPVDSEYHSDKAMPNWMWEIQQHLADTYAQFGHNLDMNG